MSVSYGRHLQYFRYLQKKSYIFYYTTEIYKKLMHKRVSSPLKKNTFKTYKHVACVERVKQNSEV